MPRPSSGIVFAYYNDASAQTGPPDFACALKCRQCEAMAHKGRKRCTKRTCFGVPYCHIHIRWKLHLAIADSTIPNAGKGLFAWNEAKRPNGVVFRRGNLITEYIGENLGKRDLDARVGDDGLAAYALEPVLVRRGGEAGVPVEYGENDTLIIDAACVRGIASFANALSDNRQTNATLGYRMVGTGEARRRVAGLFAKKDIRHKEEILVSYGENYDPADTGVSHFTRKTGNKKRAIERGFTEKERTSKKYDISQAKLQ